MERVLPATANTWTERHSQEVLKLSMGVKGASGWGGFQTGRTLGWQSVCLDGPTYSSGFAKLLSALTYWKLSKHLKNFLNTFDRSV